MAKATPIIAAMNAGEWSPLLSKRIDLQGYAAAARTLENFIATVQGPAVRRGGMPHVNQMKNSANRTWLVPFVRSRSIAYQIEFGDGYCRFYFNRAPVLTGSTVAITSISRANPGVVTATAHGYSNGDDVFLAGVTGMTEVNARWFKVVNATANTFELTTIHGVNVDTSGYAADGAGGTADTPYEIVSPYSAADLVTSKGELALDFVQSRDVLYVAQRNGSYLMRRLTRTSSASWAFTTVDPDDGPFLDTNSTDTTIYASGATGTITLTASTSMFTAAHVGALIRVDQEDLTATPQWVTATAYTAGDFVRSEGKEYEAATSGTSGTTIPSHTQGTASDGAVNWTYRSAGYGIARITAQSGTTATATVLTRFPQTVIGSGNPSTLWRLGAWSGVGSYPRTVRFDNERLVAGAEDRVDWSVSSDFESFALDDFGEILATSAISVEIQSSEVNDVVAMVEGSALTLLTEGGEFIAQKITTTEPFGPGNVEIVPGTTFGSRPIRAIRVGEAVIFAQSSGLKLRELIYDIQVDNQIARDLTVRAEHIVKPRITGLSRQKEPWQMLYMPRSDGQCVALTYDRTQEVRGFGRFIAGGTNAQIECVSVIPSPDGDRDDVWFCISRSINGQTRRYVEYITKEYETGDVQADAFYVDSGATYSGAAASTIRGLDHLEGETVQILADGARHPDRVVTNGEVTLEVSASKAQIGLSAPCRYESLSIEAGAADGTAQTKTKRITDVSFSVSNTLGGRAGPSFEDMDQIPELEFRAPSAAMDQAPPLFTGDTTAMGWPGGYETESRICYENTEPFPVTLISAVPQVVTEESR